MKYIKVDKNGNIVAHLNSDIPNHNKEYIEVKDFPEEGFNSKLINGKVLRGNKIVSPVLTRTIPNPFVDRLKSLEDRVTKLEQQSKDKLDRTIITI